MSKMNPFQHYLKGTQIALSVLVAAFIGHQIDQQLNNEKHIITIIFSIISIVYTLRALIKDVNKEK